MMVLLPFNRCTSSIGNVKRRFGSVLLKGAMSSTAVETNASHARSLSDRQANPHIEQLVEAVSKLSLLDTCDFVTALKVPEITVIHIRDSYDIASFLLEKAQHWRHGGCSCCSDFPIP